MEVSSSSETSPLKDGMEWDRQEGIPTSLDPPPQSSTTTSDEGEKKKKSKSRRKRKSRKGRRRSLRVAVEGCGHGELDQIYSTIKETEEHTGKKVDLLLCCGDFECMRNLSDLHSLNVPPKYLHMGSFYQYYSGEKVAPTLTICIGGNHEASNYFQELYYGGWVAPRIYFLGYSGVINVGGLKIGGISGIYNSRNFKKGHFEYPPYNPSTIISVYHTREYEIFKMAQYQQKIDIFLTHDWPVGITKEGNEAALLREKPFFESDIRNNALGNPGYEQLMNRLKPRYWFAAHLHCKFAAIKRFGFSNNNINVDLNQKQKSSSFSSSTTNTTTIETENKTRNERFMIAEERTQFLALGKCVPGKEFLQFIDIETNCINDNNNDNGNHNFYFDVDDNDDDMKGDEEMDDSEDQDQEDEEKDGEELSIEYDLEWLSILKQNQAYLSKSNGYVNLPRNLSLVSHENIDWVNSRLKERFENENQATQAMTSLKDKEEEDKDHQDTLTNDKNISFTRKDDSHSHLIIPLEHFVPTESAFDPIENQAKKLFTPGRKPNVPPGLRKGNPQTDMILDLLELNHIVTIPYKNNAASFQSSQDDPNFNSLPKSFKVVNSSSSLSSNTTEEQKYHSNTGISKEKEESTSATSFGFFEDFGDEDDDNNNTDNRNNDNESTQEQAYVSTTTKKSTSNDPNEITLDEDEEED